jgi:hypothetical protein
VLTETCHGDVIWYDSEYYLRNCFQGEGCQYSTLVSAYRYSSRFRLVGCWVTGWIFVDLDSAVILWRSNSLPNWKKGPLLNGRLTLCMACMTLVISLLSIHFALFWVHPDLSHLWVFGCKCYPSLAVIVAHKLASRSIVCVLFWLLTRAQRLSLPGPSL